MRLIYLRYLKAKRRQLLSVLVICAGVLSLLLGLLTPCTEAQTWPRAQTQTQAIGGRENRWQIIPSLSLYEQYTDNVDLRNENEVGAYITQFSPGLMFQLPSSRRQLRINTNLKLDYRDRDDGRGETLYWYNLFGYLGNQYSPRTSYELNMGYNIYYTEKDITAPFIDVFDALTRSDVFYIQPGLSYNITKTTTAKLGAKYGFSTYEDPKGVDGQDIGSSLFVTQQVGSRIVLGTGYTYRKRSYNNDTGYTEHEIPIDLSLDLTYIRLNLSSAYITREYEDMRGYSDEPFKAEAFFLYGIGFELGGQLLKLRSTTLELNYVTNYFDDLYGFPYQNQEVRLSLYHALKKFDFYADLKYGLNSYTQSDDKISYWGTASGLKWYISDKAYMSFIADYTSYEYEFKGFTEGPTRAYDIFTGSTDYNYNIYDWLFVGLGYGRREGSSDVNAGNYSENLYSLFAKATW